MKSLLKRVEAFRKPADSAAIYKLILHLGEETSIPVLEEVLKHYKKEEDTILTKDLLEWMQEKDQVNFETDDLKVSIQTYVSAKVSDSDAAFKWLEDNQYGDLIKDTLDFPKGEFTKELARLLDERGTSYFKKSGIHPQSLKKIMSDRLKACEDLPEEENGIAVNFFDKCQVKCK